MEKVKNSAEKFQIEGVNAEIQMLKKEGKISSAGEISDGYHTFNQIYHHRAILFASILELIPSKYTWKSKLHHDGTMYDDMFIVGITTQFGQATYHYDVDPYWSDAFIGVPEITMAPEFDGHTPEEALMRIQSFCRYIKQNK